MKDEDIFELEEDSAAPAASGTKSFWSDMKRKVKKVKKQQKGPWWKSIWTRQVALAIVAVIVLILLTHFLLLQITRHGSTFAIPDFTGMTMEEASKVAKDHHLRLDVTDSVYIHQLPRGAVFKQNPPAPMFVKKNRRVLLTINALSPRKVLVPNVVGFSLRQAKSVLSAQGLEVGTLTYTPDIATNTVLEQYYKGALIGQNLKLPADSHIDLLLGVNDVEARTSIPQLSGLNCEQARDLMLDYSLNVGRIQYDGTVKNYTDSIAAKVYRQIPAAAPQSELWNLGARVDIYLTLDPEKLPKE